MKTLKHVVILAVAVCAGLIPLPLSAQRATATISGTVSDATGAVIPMAKVRATNVETGTIQTAVSESQGRYRIAELPVGEYRVQVESVGFQSMVRTGVVLTVGSENVVDFALTVGAASEEVRSEEHTSELQ